VLPSISRQSAAAGVLLAAFALAACSGETSLGEALQATGAVPAGSGASIDQPEFNPFGDAVSTPKPARQVIQNPSLAEVLKPGPLPEMALGRDDAPVTIVEYASLTCPYCRKFHLETFPKLKREYIDTGKVRFILREFPIGLQSGAATIALRCAPQERYFELFGKFLEQQARWVSQEVRHEPIFKIAAQVGMTRPQFDACYENQGMIDALKAIKDRGRTLGVIGTPNFFINNRLVKTVIGMEEIREMVEPMLTNSSGPGKVTATR
jgi:protein-disulfide isomerase